MGALGGEQRRQRAAEAGRVRAAAGAARGLGDAGGAKAAELFRAPVRGARGQCCCGDLGARPALARAPVAAAQPSGARSRAALPPGYP